MRRRVLASMGKPLPYDERLDYISSTGSCRIETNVVPQFPFIFEAEYRNDVAKPDRYLCAMFQDSGNFRWYCCSVNDSVWYAACGSNPGGIKQFNDGSFHRIRSEFSESGGKFFVDGLKIQDFTCDFAGTPTMTLWLFDRHIFRDDGFYYACIGSLKNARITSGGVLVRDYIPCLKNGHAELYDSVNGVFATRHGEFAAPVSSRGGGTKCLTSSSRSWWRSRASRLTSHRWEVAA